MSTFTSDLAAAELWPIKAKGAVTRLNPLGDPQIEQYYHNAMEQGRYLERNIADAQHWLQQKKKDLMEKISIQARMNQLSVDGQLSNPARAVKYIADGILILRDINKFQQEIIGLISAIAQNIGILLTIEKNMLAMVQANLNALANLLHEICNWGLPKLPSIPNLLKDTIWHWNGFNFAPLNSFSAILKSLEMSKLSFSNFTFGLCIILPAVPLPSGTPSTIPTYSGLTYGTPLFSPPLNGVVADPTNVSLLQNDTTIPSYLPPNSDPINLANPFNPNTSMWGAVPDPSTIISDYQMPSATYQANIVSIVPSLRDLTIEPTDPDYANPNLTVRDADLSKALIEYINLATIVSSNYDPNITAAWLFYLNLNRVGRSGSWLQNFQVAYSTLISPSLEYLVSNDVPWNCVLPSDQVNDAPTAIPLIATLTGSDPTTQGNLLWRLSYIEAALLGYTRNQTWDAYADAGYVSSFTGTDLDYRATTINTLMTTITLGETIFLYPVWLSW